MAAEGEAVPAHVLRADEKAKSNAVPHVNFYDPSVYKARAVAGLCFFLSLFFFIILDD